ncbi:hypothetical protein HMPREF1155_0282 [Slackia sp. CM382]|nr:hypothetical protein HMPREF1155_0282 [Slackia sp. CM382]
MFAAFTASRFRRRSYKLAVAVCRSLPPACKRAASEPIRRDGYHGFFLRILIFMQKGLRRNRSDTALRGGAQQSEHRAQ